jgi:hypothetical protein
LFAELLNTSNTSQSHVLGISHNEGTMSRQLIDRQFVDGASERDSQFNEQNLFHRIVWLAADCSYISIPFQPMYNSVMRQ